MKFRVRKIDAKKTGMNKHMKWVSTIDFRFDDKNYQVFGYGDTKKAATEWTTEKLGYYLVGDFSMEEIEVINV